MEPNAENQNPSQPVMDVQPPQPDTAPAPMSTVAPMTAETPNTDKPAESPLAIKPSELPKKSRGPLGAIVVAMLVMIGLSVTAFMLYRNTQNPVPVKSGQVNTQSELTPAESVDNTISEVDETLKSIDDGQDFDDSSLSDSNLGL